MTGIMEKLKWGQDKTQEMPWYHHPLGGNLKYTSLKIKLLRQPEMLK